MYPGGAGRELKTFSKEGADYRGSFYVWCNIAKRMRERKLTKKDLTLSGDNREGRAVTLPSLTTLMSAPRSEDPGYDTYSVCGAFVDLLTLKY